MDRLPPWARVVAATVLGAGVAWVAVHLVFRAAEGTWAPTASWVTFTVFFALFGLVLGLLEERRQRRERHGRP